MRSNIANWLLTLGVVVGALAAAGSKKAYRVVDLDPAVDLSGELLYATVEHQRTPGEDPIVLAESGTPLDVVAMTRLVNAGIERVRVRFPARDSEVVPIDEAEGRVLSEDILLEGETQTLKTNRVLSSAVVQRAQDAGIETIRVREQGSDDPPTDYPTMDAPEPQVEGAPYDSRYWRLDEETGEVDPISGPDGVDVDTFELAADLVLPSRMPKSSFLEEVRVAKLRELGVTEVAVKTRAPFTWSGWTQRWWFLGAVLIVLAAIALKRMDAEDHAADESGKTPADGVRAALGQVISECEQLAASAPTMDADALHRAIDPITSGALYRVVEGREAVKAALGLGGFAEVYGPLASGERVLNRAWSAAVDGYLEEAQLCAQDCVQHFRDALAKWPAPR